MKCSDNWSYYVVDTIIPIAWYETMPLFIKRNNPILCIYHAGEFNDPNCIPLAVNELNSDPKYLLPDGYYKSFSLDRLAACKTISNSINPVGYAAALARYMRATIHRQEGAQQYCRALYRIKNIDVA